jgi:hypothetical protein
VSALGIFNGRGKGFGDLLVTGPPLALDASEDPGYVGLRDLGFLPGDRDSQLPKEQDEPVRSHVEILC